MDARLTRRRFGALLTGMLASGLVPGGRASAASRVVVPIPLQVELFTKVANYDRGLPERAGSTVRILVVENPKHAGSLAAGGQLRHGLASVEAVAGLPVRVSGHAFEGAAGLAARCRQEGAAVVYLTPGLTGDAQAIASALQGIPVLSASLVPDDVSAGVVLGFDLDEGKPRILVNLRLARAQDVKLKSALLKLATIVER